MRPTISTAIKDTTPFIFHNTVTFGKIRGILDFSEHRLRRLIDDASGEVRMSLEQVLREYMTGKIALAWHHGAPCTMPVKKEK